MKNLILLTIDTLRKDVLGCYGDEGGLSPFMDSIQKKCIRFTKAHATGPYTQASFPGILTSSYYLEYGRQKMLSRKRILISEVLQKAGITTAAFHSNPYLSAYFGWNRGWDVFYDSMKDKVNEMNPYIKSLEINKKAGGWLSSHLGPGHYKRFFLWVHYMDVHEPYVPVREYLDRLDPTIKLSDNEMLKLFKDVVLKRDASDNHVVDLLRKLYRALISEVDDSVRDLFGIFEEKNILKDSVVIITADHGDEFGDHGGLSHDGKMYSELVNVPLIIYEPEREEGIVCDTLVTTLDVAPTIAYLFGLDPVEKYKGCSFFPLEKYPVKAVFGEAVDKHGSHEKGEEKGIYYYREGDAKIIYQERDDAWELYDLQSDPSEKNNIVSQSPIAETMKQKIMSKIERERS